jgi:hypothetical protein
LDADGIVGSTQRSGNFPLGCCDAGFDRSTPQNILFVSNRPRAAVNNNDGDKSNSADGKREPMTVMCRAWRAEKDKRQEYPSDPGEDGGLAGA